MNRKLKLFTVMTLITATVMSTGCSVLFKKKEEVKADPPKVETPDTSEAEDKKVLGVLDNYFSTLYSAPIEDYNVNIMSGEIPQNIHSFIATRTIEEANGNPEIGIHLPRVVEINGLTITGYEMLKDNNPIESDFIGKMGENFLYYVRLNFKVKALPNDVFLQYYLQNPDTKIYERVKENGQDKVIDENLYDYIKVQLRYDVEVAKEEAEYKIVTQKEANYKPGVKNRLFKLNNDFMTRLSYLDINIESEKKVYEEEKAVIEAFFNNLLMLDKERMILLKSKWEAGAIDFVDFITQLGIPKADGKDLLFVSNDYKNKFDYKSFPLQLNMENISKYNNFKVDVHPGYSMKNKRYFVSFEAPLVKSNGMVGKEEVYMYDYYVTLKSESDKLLIDSFKLNEYYKK